MKNSNQQGIEKEKENQDWKNIVNKLIQRS